MSDESSKAAGERLRAQPPGGSPPGARLGAAAFGELFESHEAVVGRLCSRMLGRGAAAEDAVSEVFLRAQRALASYDAERPFRPWILAIATHYCIDQLRRRGSEARIFDPSELDGELLPDPGPSPLRQAVSAEERAEILAAVDALPVRYRAPLVLRYFNELDYEAIAGELGITRGQVGTLLFRAKRRLREALTASRAARSGIAGELRRDE